MIFRNTNYTLNFRENDINIPVKDNIDLLGINIEKNLQFNSHVKNICTEVNNQINVISRFRKIVSTDVKCKLYRAFIVPYFRYCSAVWHFCGARNRHKLENLNKRVLRIVVDEKSQHSTRSFNLTISLIINFIYWINLFIDWIYLLYILYIIYIYIIINLLYLFKYNYNIKNYINKIIII